MSPDRVQVEAALLYLGKFRNVKIDKKSCRFWAKVIRGDFK